MNLKQIIVQAILVHLIKAALVKIKCPKKDIGEKQILQIYIYDLNSEKINKIPNSTAEVNVTDANQLSYVCIYTYYVLINKKYRSLEMGLILFHLFIRI